MVDAQSKLRRVLLVDDHPAILVQITQLLREDFEVVEMLWGGSGLEEALERFHPDLILLDISLPGVSGLKLARDLKKTGCSVRIVFLTMHEDADFAREALALGGVGYVVKARLGTDLPPALCSAFAGQYFVSPCPGLADLVSLNGTLASAQTCLMSQELGRQNLPAHPRLQSQTQQTDPPSGSQLNQPK